jgi:hypothetical protein
MKKYNNSDNNHIFNKLALGVCTPPALSLFLIYTLAAQVWFKFRIWPFQDSNPAYQQFTGFLKIHDTLATLAFWALAPISFMFWVVVVIPPKNKGIQK